MTEQGRESRAALRELAWRLLGRARSGGDVAGLGEVIQVLEESEELAEAAELENLDVQVSVSVSVGFRHGDSSFEEGTYCGFRVWCEGIEFNRLSTSYSREVGSDHNSTVDAFLPWSGTAVQTPDQWFDAMYELMMDERSLLSVYRDHI